MDDLRKWFDAKYPEVDQALASALFDVADVLDAVCVNDWEALVRVGGPVEHRADTYTTSPDFATEGNYEADARYVYPARSKAIFQASRAALDRLEEVRRDPS